MQNPSDLELDWSSLATVTSFDAGTTQPLGEVEGNGMLLQDVKTFSTSSLLVESLIEQLCKMLEPNEERQKRLYRRMCTTLHKMKLIDQTYDVEEFQFLRNHYQKELFQLMSVASSVAETSNNSLFQLSTSFGLNNSVFKQQCFLDLSRYRTEFIEIKYIAKGGFGQVHKAKHKLDGGEYAIKKINLSYRSVKDFKRKLSEVKMLAQLNHPNIVSYKAAWLERCSPHNSVNLGGTVDQEELSSFLAQRNSKRHTIIIDEDSSNIVFKSQSEEAVTSKHSSLSNEQHITDSSGNAIKIRDFTHKEHASFNDESGDSSSSLDDKALCEYRGSVHNIWKFQNAVQIEQREWATLYIQMQLCDTTLSQYLDQQRSFPVDLKRSITLYRQIVQGIEYIHSKDIVHHDIKPSNIFVSSDLRLVQVGDFGLACCLQHSAPVVTFELDQSGSATQHRGEIGTKLYAAPEQLDGKCDPKSDIFSLGIVLFELVQPFATIMERVKVIEDLRKGKIPSHLASLSPKLMKLIEHLLSPLPANRPTATELLRRLDSLLNEHILHPILEEQSKDDTIKHLLDIINQKNEEIIELKHRLEGIEIGK